MTADVSGSPVRYALVSSETGDRSPLGMDASEVSSWRGGRSAVGAAGPGGGVHVSLPAGMVSAASDDLPASDDLVPFVAEALDPAECEAGAGEFGAIGLASSATATGLTGASGAVGLAGLTGSTGDTGASAMSGTWSDAGGVDTGISTIGASSAPPSTGSTRDQFGMLHHMRRKAGG
jgi:hypothetical protein